MNKQKLQQEKKIKDLKLKIVDFDLATPGTIRTIYTKCGKKNCACQTNEKARHGPYCLWDRKVNGKLSSKMVTKKMAAQIKTWIENRKMLEESVTEILILSQALAVEQVDRERELAGEKL